MLTYKNKGLEKAGKVAPSRVREGVVVFWLGLVRLSMFRLVLLAI